MGSSYFHEFRDKLNEGGRGKFEVEVRKTEQSMAPDADALVDMLEGLEDAVKLCVCLYSVAGPQLRKIDEENENAYIIL